MASITVLDVIRTALRKAQIIALTAQPSATQASECLATLNQMMNAWEQDGINLQYFVQTSTADTFPCPEYSQQGVIGMLAIMIASNFGRSVPAELSNPRGTGYADMGWQTILRKAVNDNLPRSNLSHLPRGSANWDSRITEG